MKGQSSAWTINVDVCSSVIERLSHAQYIAASNNLDGHGGLFGDFKQNVSAGKDD